MLDTGMCVSRGIQEELLHPKSLFRCNNNNKKELRLHKYGKLVFSCDSTYYSNYIVRYF